MSTAAPETATTEPAATTPPAAAEPPKPGPPPAPAPAAAPAETTEQQVARLTKELEGARAEAGKSRVNAKEAAAAEATQKIVRELAKAAGIELPGDKPDPDKLAADLATERTTGRQAVLALAIYKASPALSANADALLDSLSFQTAVKDLDPKASDFDAKVAEAIKAAVTANPNLKTGRVPGASGVDMTGGSGEPGQITEDQLKTMTPEQIVDAQNKGLLKNLLGG